MNTLSEPRKPTLWEDMRNSTAAALMGDREKPPYLTNATPVIRFSSTEFITTIQWDEEGEYALD